VTVVCPIARCRAENEPTAVSCRRCGTPLQAYVRLSAHAARLFNEGLAAARAGDHATARDRFAAIVHWYPDDTEAHNALALACYHLGAHTEAHHHWHLTLTREPDDPVARRGVAHLTAGSNCEPPEPTEGPGPPEPAAVSPVDSAVPE
jgi:tetratricopeptide (TPR) repeat protein